MANNVKILFVTDANDNKFYPITIADAVAYIKPNNGGIVKLSDYLNSLATTFVAAESGKRLMTDAEGTKLAGIETGAQVNVKPDWNAASGAAAEILNKPTLGTAAATDATAYATAAQGGKADTAVQSVKITGSDTELKSGTNVVLPAYPTTLPASDVSDWAKAATKPSYTAAEVGAIASTEKGANNGVATLGSDGKVPSSQLPSYVDDVLEYVGQSNFPATGEDGKIYVDTTNNTTWRWSGSQYVQIKGDLVIGTTTGTAADGGTVSGHISDTDIHVTTANKTAWNAKYDKPSGGIPKTDLANAVQTSLGLADTAVQPSDISDFLENADVKVESTRLSKTNDASGNGFTIDLSSSVQTSLGKADSALQAVACGDTSDYADVSSLFTTA